MAGRESQQDGSAKARVEARRRTLAESSETLAWKGAMTAIWDLTGWGCRKRGQRASSIVLGNGRRAQA